MNESCQYCFHENTIASLYSWRVHLSSVSANTCTSCRACVGKGHLVLHIQLPSISTLMRQEMELQKRKSVEIQRLYCSKSHELVAMTDEPVSLRTKYSPYLERNNARFSTSNIKSFHRGRFQYMAWRQPKRVQDHMQISMMSFSLVRLRCLAISCRL